jgi:hypothetical protein
VFLPSSRILDRPNRYWYRRNQVRAISLQLTCVLISFAGVAHAQQTPAADSFARIRDALQKPPSRLLLDLPEADFSVYIEQRRPLQDIFERPPWVSPPPEFPAPPGSNRDAHDSAAVGVSFDWLAAAHAVSRAVRTHQARGEVERAIADYCIAHRDEAGAEAICAEPFR